jgi:hypothetical protein
LVPPQPFYLAFLFFAVRFLGICSGKISCGGMVFLLGIFEFLACFVVVNRGEVVVECVANVVC